MPSIEIAIHDTRLSGSIYPRPRVSLLETADHETLEQLTRRIAATARAAGGTVSDMRIYAHGVRPVGASGPGDGRQILLAQERVHRGNAGIFGLGLAGLISGRIWLYVCAAAARPDGEATCLALAYGAGVPVVASRQIQDYSTHSTSTTFGDYEIPGTASPDWINFGRWEGEVIVCHPDGRADPWFTGPAPVSSRDVHI